MVKAKHFIFLISLLLLISCGKNEFTLDFNLSEEVKDNYNVTYYATDTKGGLTIQAVASVRDGKCLLQGVTKYPTLIYITARKSNYPLVILVNKGEKIKISGVGTDPLDWNVEDGEINKSLSDWRKDNLQFLLNNETDSVNHRVSQYVENHREDPASLLLVMCYYNREKDERGYSDLMASLRGEAKDNKWLQIVGRSDQLFHYYYYPAKFESMVMRSNTDFADTLLADGKNPLLLIFWQTGFNERKNLVDSVKLLKKEFPDSVRLIADICLDTDSMAWRNAIRRDSLDYIKRFWAPSSLADPTIMKFNVKSIPYFIVFDKEGSQIYRGSDFSAALKDYRTQHERKDSV